MAGCRCVIAASQDGSNQTAMSSVVGGPATRRLDHHRTLLAGHVAPAGAREQAGTETGLQRFEPAEQGRRIALEFAGGRRQFAVAGDGFDAAQVD